MYYLQSRYYDPTTGRFINADGLVDNRGVGVQNMFAYCLNNSTNKQDPTGLCSIQADDGTWIAYNGVRGDGTSGITDYQTKQASKTQPKTPWKIPQKVVENNNTLIKKLDPKIQSLALEFLAKANDAGYAVFITWGKRSNEDEQYFIDYTGDKKAGVWNGKHTKGLAFDVEFWDPLLEGIWPETNPRDFWATNNSGIHDPNNPSWAKIGVIGKSVGLEWGGSFMDVDLPHFYLN